MSRRLEQWLTQAEWKIMTERELDEVMWTANGGFSEERA
jgi:hypothetical protein